MPSDDLENVSSAVSDFDSFSDSDWLDIASNRESDDNDSLCSRDSFDHHEIPSLPLSRRSSMSIGSSRGDEPDCWTGYSSDASDSGLQVNARLESDNSDNTSLPKDTEVDIAEDRRVKEALDQSMIGTLNASRSSPSTTVQNSLRDLRLSFPDPLTSSRDELNRSYEAVSPISVDASSVDGVESIGSSVAEDTAHAAEEAPGSLPTSDAPQPSLSTDADVDVVLYGSCPTMRWTLVQELMLKASFEEAIAGHPSVSPKKRHLSTYAVYDYTHEFSGSQPVSKCTFDRPSIAFVFLPCTGPVFAQHTLYLPIVAAEEAVCEENWRMQAIPSDRVVRFASNLQTTVEIANADPVAVQKAFRALGGRSQPPSTLEDARPLVDGRPTPANQNLTKMLLQALVEHFTSRHAVTIFALLSIIVGFAVNTSFRVSTPVPELPTTTTVCESATSSTPGFWGLFGNNASTSVALRTSTGMSVRSATLNYTPAVQHRGSTEASTTSLSTRTPGDVSTGPKPSEKVKSPTDVVVRPSTLSADSFLKVPTPALTSVTESSTAMTTSLSVRLVDSLSEFVDYSYAKLHEINELAEALDKLTHTIGQQTDKILEEAQSFRESLHYRNERAKDNAALLKNKGVQLMTYAGDQLRDRTVHAKKTAKLLKDSLVQSEMWRTCQSEWFKDEGSVGKHQRKKEAKKTRFFTAF